MSPPIEFWFDFSSPYAYFASHRIEEVAASAGRDVLWRPFMLGSVFKETGARPFLQIPLKGPYAVRDWERLAGWHGVRWTLPVPFPVAALPAARGFYWVEAREPDVASRFAHACLDAYFGEGRDISRVDTVADIAEGVGVSGASLASAIEEAHWKDRLRQAGDEAVAKGVCGSPFMIADGEGFWGSDRLPMLADWLRRGGW